MVAKEFISFNDKIVLVTGASAGIGQATGELFLDLGATVIGTMHTANKTSFTEKADQYPNKCFTKRLNAADSTQVEKLVGEVMEEFGRIDILINNAGIYLVGSVTETSEADWDRLVGTNLKSVFLLSHYVIPHMQAAKAGVVVNIASRTGHQAVSNLAAYCASKAAIIHLTRQMAVDYIKDNIRINSVTPAMVETPLIDRLYENDMETKQKVIDSYPIKRFARADEVANAIIFLASDRASYTTGAALALDGARGVI